MSIPESCTVLVVGGGPGGSYAATCLAREGVDVVCIEADIFPRYHIGESMLASFRHFLRFIDLDQQFIDHGFQIKKGAAFKINDKKEGYTDFIATGGPNNYTWNVIRSEADDMMFKHAGKCGAKIFDGTKIESLEFVPELEFDSFPEDPLVGKLGRPVSATWSRKDGSKGIIKFDYVVDASGRAGIVSTKHLKNRKFNAALKNSAVWGYWKGVKKSLPGTYKEGQPYFENLADASGWCWAIPLHNGTVSVGIVRRVDDALADRRSQDSPSDPEFYHSSLKKLTPYIRGYMLEEAELVSPVKSASDWSYSASCYSSPYVRIVGDAGCFIDPYFSSGVHLALAGGLSAAMTIQAARNGEISEFAAAQWHSSKVREGYTRFLLVVATTLKQIRLGNDLLLSDMNEEGFDKAFAHFRPIIQGQADADVGGRLTQDEVSKTVDFCLNAYENYEKEDTEKVLAKLEKIKIENHGHSTGKDTQADLERLTEDELKILQAIRAKQMLRLEDIGTIKNFESDAFYGFAPRLKTGNLGLNKIATEESIAHTSFLDPAQEVKVEA